MILDFVLDVAAKTGIILDPVYTGKTAMGLVHELNHNRSRFKGNRILFIHTGKRWGQACLHDETEILHKKWFNLSPFYSFLHFQFGKYLRFHTSNVSVSK